MKPDLVIRADASPEIGLGHVSRCLALAEPWVKAGANVVLLTREPSAATRERAERAGVIVEDLKGELDAVVGEWVVLDGYHFTAEDQRRWKQRGARLLAFDDGGGAHRYCADFVLNQNFGAAEKLYPNREPATRLLLGPRFAQLRAELLRARPTQRQVPKVAKKLLVTAGGSDPNNATAEILRRLKDFEVTAVVGPENRYSDELAKEFPNVQLLKNPSNFPELMAESEIAISAAGSTAWELAYLGVPLVAIVIAENQRANAEHVERAGLGRLASIDKAATEAANLAADLEVRKAMVALQRAVFDGHGSFRVWLRMNEEKLRLREARNEDARLIWNWANEPGVRAVSFTEDPIPWEKHCEWFTARLANSNCRLWIAENRDGTPVGQIRFDLGESSATLSISLDAAWRGKNFGPLLIWIGCRKLFAETPVSLVNAYVRKENAPSARAFEKADFRLAGTSVVSGREALHFELSRANVEA
jgi:UDP-2,4-diacetamido-2,4,6-trideoxy-beta-L-altropyranose hydrolase